MKRIILDNSSFEKDREKTKADTLAYGVKAATKKRNATQREFSTFLEINKSSWGTNIFLRFTFFPLLPLMVKILAKFFNFLRISTKCFRFTPIGYPPLRPSLHILRTGARLQFFVMQSTYIFKVITA